MSGCADDDAWSNDGSFANDDWCIIVDLNNESLSLVKYHTRVLSCKIDI